MEQNEQKAGNTERAACRPRSIVLVSINVLIWVGLGLLVSRSVTAIGLILLVVNLAAILVITTVAQVGIHFMLRRRKVKPAMRVLIFLLPTAAIVAIGVFAPRPPTPPNQQQGSPSPSGKYVLFVPNNERSENPTYAQLEVWKVTIKDTEGNVLYRHEESDFLSHLSVYWTWDADDRVWLYNTDDGNVHFWESNGEVWSHSAWGYGRSTRSMHKTIDRDIAPPDSLYPDYFR